MPRLRLISERDGLNDTQRAAFDWIVESRGKMIRPYEVLLHAPGLAKPAAELGHVIRFEGELSDHHRELAIIAVGRAHGCDFEWDSHIDAARAAGVSPEAESVLNGGDARLEADESVIVDYVMELCADSTVAEATFKAAVELIGASGVVELTGLVGYYTMLSYVMSIADACG